MALDAERLTLHACAAASAHVLSGCISIVSARRSIFSALSWSLQILGGDQYPSERMMGMLSAGAMHSL